MIGAAFAGGGCGGGLTSQPSPPTKRIAAPVLVAFQRNGGLAATLDALVIRTDGSARLDKRYGGAGRRFEDFRLTRGLLGRLRGLLDALPSRLAEAGGSTPNGARYHGRGISAVEGAVPRNAERAFAALNAIVDGAGRGAVLDGRTIVPGGP